MPSDSLRTPLTIFGAVVITESTQFETKEAQ
jgi:hypothetical protein